MDCHNRPSHDYQPPFRFVNQAIAAGEIPKELPGIKSVAMESLAPAFPSTDSAMNYIHSYINKYYQETYEELYKTRKGLIDSAITGIQTE